MSQPETTVEEARSTIRSHTPLLPPVTKKVEESAGYVLAEDVKAEEPVQPFRNSAMDGYAVRYSEAEQAREPGNALEVVGEVAAGDPGTLEVGEEGCVKIMTGAPVPEDLDTVVRVEDAVTSNGSVYFTRMPSNGRGDNVRQAGEDIQVGQRVLRSGQPIRPYELGVAVLSGRREVEVHRRPRVAVISTGNELVHEPGAALGPGQVRDINRFTLADGARQAGASVQHVSSLPDDFDQSIERIRSLFESHDVVVTSGGISMGEYDFMGDVMEKTDVTLVFHKVWQKPGKPLGFGVGKKTLLFALPGNVVSSIVNFEIYVRPTLLRMRGFEETERQTRMIPASEPFPETDRRTFFFRGRYEQLDHGLGVRPTGTGQGSHIMTSLSEADCLVEVAPQTDVEEGDPVKVMDLNHPFPVPMNGRSSGRAADDSHTG